MRLTSRHLVNHEYDKLKLTGTTKAFDTRQDSDVFQLVQIISRTMVKEVQSQAGVVSNFLWIVLILLLPVFDLIL